MLSVSNSVYDVFLCATSHVPIYFPSLSLPRFASNKVFTLLFSRFVHLYREYPSLKSCKHLSCLADDSKISSSSFATHVSQQKSEVNTNCFSSSSKFPRTQNLAAKKSMNTSYLVTNRYLSGLASPVHYKITRFVTFCF